ncbi:Myomegalin [Dissostichus eleginoides]|uniref:Myomegalin n=1 Tax=Dissostichus eleginoides TaxID=100907 RepID=A0AAD9F898_DISEL|nr:Myomegalin [Dissostichus eleginoides]
MPPTEEPPVIMNNSGFRGCRTISQHLNDLKKENFSLKLRIYFLEEKIQQKFEESGDDVHKRNIMLKVEVESLKKELEEKQQFLDQALLTAESLSNQNEAELQRRLEDRQEEIIHMQEILETKVQLLQEEAELARGGQLSQQALADKDRLIEELTQQKHSLSLQLEELHVKVHHLSSPAKSKERAVSHGESRVCTQMQGLIYT